MLWFEEGWRKLSAARGECSGRGELVDPLAATRDLPVNEEMSISIRNDHRNISVVGACFTSNTIEASTGFQWSTWDFLC